MKRLLFAPLLLLALLSAPLHAAQSGTVSLEADSIVSIGADQYEGRGNVLIRQDNLTVSADRFLYNRLTGQVEAEGNIRVKDSDTELKASFALFDTKTERGRMDNITGFIAPYTYFSAASIAKQDNLTFELTDACVSTCEGLIPDWSFRFGKAHIEVGGYLVADHARVNVKQVPILYIPKLVYPIKLERESGLLIPTFGTSNVKGTIIQQRYFWAMDVDKDATLGVNYFGKIGFQYLGEFRYAISNDEKIVASYEFLEDKETQSGTETRWRIKQDTALNLARNLRFTSRSDYVSDYYYTSDFDRYVITPTRNDDRVYFHEANLEWKTALADATLSYRDSMQFNDNLTLNGYERSNLYFAPHLNARKAFNLMPYLHASYDVDYHDVLYTEEHVYLNTQTERLLRERYRRSQAVLSFWRPFDFGVATLTPSISQYYTRWDFSRGDYSVSDYDVDSFLSMDMDDDSITRKIYRARTTLTTHPLVANIGSARMMIFNSLAHDWVPELNQDGLPEHIVDDKLDYRDSYSYEINTKLQADDWKASLVVVQPYDIAQKNRVRPVHINLNAEKGELLSNALEVRYDYYGENDESERLYFLDDTLTLDFGSFSLIGTYLFNLSAKGSDNTEASLATTFDVGKLTLGVKNKWKGSHASVSIDNLRAQERTFMAVYNSVCWSLGAEVSENITDRFTTDGLKQQHEYIFSLVIKLRGVGDINQHLGNVSSDE